MTLNSFPAVAVAEQAGRALGTKPQSPRDFGWDARSEVQLQTPLSVRARGQRVDLPALQFPACARRV